MNVLTPAPHTSKANKFTRVSLSWARTLVAVGMRDPATIDNHSSALYSNWVGILFHDTVEMSVTTFITVDRINYIETILQYAIDCLLAGNQDFLRLVQLS